MLLVDDLSTAYLRNVRFEVARNSLNGILGPSGSGKTTLLRHIAGLCQSGEAIKWMEQPRAIRWISSSLPSELQRLTLREALERHGCKDPERWAANFSVDHKLNVRGDVGILSTGELRCVGLALGLYDLQPESVVLVDELTNGLSTMIVRKIMKVLRKLQSEQKILIICSLHQPTMDIMKLFDQVFILASGRVILASTPDALVRPEQEPEELDSELMALFDQVDSDCDWVENDEAYAWYDVSRARKYTLSMKDTWRLQWTLKLRSPALMATAIFGTLIVVLLNLLINANNQYVSKLLPVRQTESALDLGLDHSLKSWPVLSPEGERLRFNHFSGNIENPETADFVSKFSYSFVSTILFGMPVYDSKTGAATSEQIVQPILSYLSDLDKAQVDALVGYTTQIGSLLDCTYEKLSEGREPVDRPYRQYTSAFEPTSLDPLVASHRLMLVLDYLTIERAALWREVQAECLSTPKDPVSLYWCVAEKIKDLINVATDCLGWPPIPLLNEQSVASAVEQLFSRRKHSKELPAKKSRNRSHRRLSTAPISKDAWYELHSTLTFVHEPLASVLGKLLAPSIASDSVRRYYWLVRFDEVLSRLRDAALKSCRYSICQLPLLIWPYIISGVRDLLRLVWVDVSNVALVFVLTAVVGCSGLESALSFGDLRQVTSYYDDRNRHYWARSGVELLIFAVPSFMMGAIVTASLRINMTTEDTVKCSLLNGLIAMFGCFSANSLSTAIAACFRNRLQSLIASAISLSLFLLVSGFVLKQAGQYRIIDVLSYLSMFRFTYKGMLMNLYAHADGRVGVMSDSLTLAFVGGVYREREPTVGMAILLLAGQTVFYRVLGWAVFHSVHKTHFALAEQ